MKEGDVAQKKPNPNDCNGCRWFIHANSMIADRFYVKDPACRLQDMGKSCICLVNAISESDVTAPDDDTLRGN